MPFEIFFALCPEFIKRVKVVADGRRSSGPMELRVRLVGGEMDAGRGIEGEGKFLVWLERGEEGRDGGRSSSFGPTKVDPSTNGRIQAITPFKFKMSTLSF